MNLKVEYVDAASILHRREFQLSLPALLKHFGIAGRGPWGGLLPGLARGIGAYLLYQDFFDATPPFRFAGFRSPEPWFTDPTEQGDFSTLIGKGIADFLAKRLLNAEFTHTYEAAMYIKKLPITGSRPDFYCTTRTQQFAMEAKGSSRKTVSTAKMAEHKAQSKTGPLAVNFSVASVTYNIFDQPRCKFHDPIVSDTEFDTNANRTLAQLYYWDLLNELDDHVGRVDFHHGNRRFLAYDISPYLYLRLKIPRIHFLIDERAATGNIDPFEIVSEKISEDDLYVDVDGIGVKTL